MYGGTVDRRKSMDGLAALVEAELSLSPTMPALFVFCNRRRDKIKWSRQKKRVIARLKHFVSLEAPKYSAMGVVVIGSVSPGPVPPRPAAR